MKFCANFGKFGTSLISSKLNTAFSKPFKIYYLLFKSVLTNKTVEQTTLSYFCTVNMAKYIYVMADDLIHLHGLIKFQSYMNIGNIDNTKKLVI